MKTMLLGALLGANGCYVYEPVRPADAMLGARVRATVSPERAAELGPVLRDVTPQVSGRLVERSGEGLLLEVPLVGAAPGSSASRRVHNRVMIPSADMVSLESRRFSTWRTVAMVGGIAAAVGGGWAIIDGGESSDDKEKGGVDNAIITIFSIPFGITR
jgi:hypothetical protein